MAVYQSGIKGLFTEANPQDTPPETMKDASDVVVLRDNLAESRHGVNAQGITRSTGNWSSSFSVASSKLTVLKVDFDEAQSGNVRKYVLLSSGSSGMQELNTVSDLTGTITTNLSSMPVTYTQKPIGFTFDQSLYIVGAEGWQEMKKDTLDSGATGVKKLIEWPKFYNLNGFLQTDSVFSYNNWLSPGKRVGLRYTFLRETSYNENTSRLVESEPSSIQTILYAQNTANFSSTTLSSKAFISFALNNFFTDFLSNVNGRKYYLRIYRTKSVDISESLPTEYFQAYQDILIEPSIVLSTIKLTINDDGITGLPQLYTNPNLDGEGSRNVTPPIGESVIEYKNYHVVGNIREPLRATIAVIAPPLQKTIQTFKDLPVTAVSNFSSNTFSVDTTISTTSDLGTDTYRVFNSFNPSGTNLTSFSNSVDGLVTSASPVYATTTGSTSSSFRVYFPTQVVQTNASLTFRFTDSQGNVQIFGPVSVSTAFNNPGYYSTSSNSNGFLEYAGFTYDPITRQSVFAQVRKTPFTSNLNNHNTNLKLEMPEGVGIGQIKADIKSNASGTVTFGTDNIVCALGSATDGTIDSAVFSEPGMALIISNAGDYYLFSYKTTSVPGANQLKFENTSKISADAPPTISSSPYTVFYIPGSQANALPIYSQYYFQQSSFNLNLTTENLASATYTTVSLLPVFGKYQNPIGNVDGKTLTNAIVKGSISGFLNGNLLLSPAQLIDRTADNIVNTANGIFTLDNKIRFYKTESTGEFIVEYYGGSKIEVLLTGGTHTYDPPITTSYTTIAEYKKNNVRAISISRNNAPETFPAFSVLAPILVGSDKAKIVALAKNSNDCFILKEDGIWRMSIVGNDSVANVDNVVQIDTTTFCQAPYSVKEINEEIILLSQKGFVSIAGNDIEPIGRPIETEVKEKLQRAIANGLQGEIRAWVNEEKRIYGCTIRDSATSFTTYVFSTYTRQWTKFSLPVIDATTDSQGRTLYVVGMPTLTLGAGATLQAQVQAATSGTTTNFYLAEELHTQGLFRNESDQWDYRYIPASVALGTGTQVVLTDNSATTLPNWVRMGGTTSDITTSGLAFFVSRGAYYKKSGAFHPCTLVSRTATTVTVEFTSVPSGITTVAGDDGLYAGVPASITFNPSNIGSPNTMKMFSEYQLHVVEAVSKLSMQFITDSRTTYSTPRVFAFNTTATSRTVYRTYIPLEMMRGRWLIRKVDHDVPGERLQTASQSLSVRDTGSTNIQKAPR
jgi:hypothetical protein